MLLRDHRPQAGQWAFRPATHRPSVAASAGTGAAGHSIARRGSLAFRQAAEQPQPATQDKPSSQKVSDRQETPKRALIQRQRPSARQYSPFKKSARSRQRTEDSCPACEGRGFQIVEEVCFLPATAQTKGLRQDVVGHDEQLGCACCQTIA